MAFSQRPLLLCQIIKGAAVIYLREAVELAQCLQFHVELIQLVAHFGDTLHRADFCFDNHEADRLDQIIIATGFYAFAVIFVLIQAGYKNDGYPVARKPLADEACRFKAIQAGHFHVHNDHIDRGIFEQLQRFFATACNQGFMTRFENIIAHGMAQGCTVFDQQNFHRVRELESWQMAHRRV